MRNFNLLGVIRHVVNIADVDLVNTRATNQSSTANLNVYALELGENLTGGPLTGRTSADLNCAPSRLQNWTRSAGPGFCRSRGVLECTTRGPSSLEGPEVECGNPLSLPCVVTASGSFSTDTSFSRSGLSPYRDADNGHCVRVNEDTPP